MTEASAFLVAGNFWHACATAEIDWNWRRVGERTWMRDTGEKVRYCGADDGDGHWAFGLPHGTRIFMGYGSFFRRDRHVIDEMLRLGRLVDVTNEVWK